jgi:LAO/AO transport system kinase
MPENFYDNFRAGDMLAASRLMSSVERGGPEAEAVLSRLFPGVGRAYRVGITGGTGSGKSTLIDNLIDRIRGAGQTVGVVAEDPSSPFSGGAVLGDRVRMTHAAGDAGVFVRSIASRGSESGFSVLADELADVLDAFGRDIILLETIGVGQLEYKIRFSASTTVVVFTPESGDDVQGLKSGLMEVGDIFVVNKSDRPQADLFAADLRSTLKVRYRGTDWLPPVVPTTAHEGGGIDELMDAVIDHRGYLKQSGLLEQRRNEGLRNRIRYLAEDKIKRSFWGNPYIEAQFDVIFKRVASGQISPYEAAAKLIDSIPTKESDKR